MGLVRRLASSTDAPETRATVAPVAVESVATVASATAAALHPSICPLTMCWIGYKLRIVAVIVIVVSNSSAKNLSAAVTDRYHLLGIRHKRVPHEFNLLDLFHAVVENGAEYSI